MRDYIFGTTPINKPKNVNGTEVGNCVRVVRAARVLPGAELAENTGSWRAANGRGRARKAGNIDIDSTG